MTEAIEWKSISLTHVQYIRGDSLGYVLAWTSLSPIFLLVSLATLIVFRRDLHTIFFSGGFFVNEAINLALKYTIKEPRPIARGDMVEFGMPSSHSQFMWFFASYLLLFLFIRVHHNVSALDNVWKYIVSLGALALAFTVCCSRVYLKYHTHSQVLCGAAIGVCLGCTWFCMVHLLFTPLFPTIAAWPVSEFFMIRDSTLIPNVLWFEYCASRGEARSRQRKYISRKSS